MKAARHGQDEPALSAQAEAAEIFRRLERLVPARDGVVAADARWPACGKSRGKGCRAGDLPAGFAEGKVVTRGHQPHMRTAPVTASEMAVRTGWARGESMIGLRGAGLPPFAPTACSCAGGFGWGLYAGGSAVSLLELC
jgi:hypothetical protein